MLGILVQAIRLNLERNICSLYHYIVLLIKIREIKHSTYEFHVPNIHFQYDTSLEKKKLTDPDKSKATVAEIYPWIKEEV